jgi:hypothetical protein
VNQSKHPAGVVEGDAHRLNRFRIKDVIILTR